MLWFVIPLIILSPVYAIEITSTSRTVCVRPTDQPHIQCDCHLQTETDCRTLDEWISLGVDGSSKLNPFTSNTTVILLAGVHLINSTKNQLLIEDVHSLVLTGDKSNTTVTCIQDFSIAFVNSNHVSLSNITINSCALRFSIVNNTQLINLSVINSRLMIFPKAEDLGHYYSNGMIYIRNVIFTNVNCSSVSVSVSIVSVHKLVLQNVKIIQSTSDSLLYLKRYNKVCRGLYIQT